MLADDLSGAAEAGGIALRFGLTAEVHMCSHPADDVDMIVVNTETRGCSGLDAAERVRQILQCNRGLPHRPLFKKVDSVFRGNVLAELAAVLEVGPYRRAILAPSNPSLGRSISKGQYWVDGKPLHCTDFAHDPEYPADTSDVKRLLHARDVQHIARSCPVTICPPGAQPPMHGIVVGDVNSTDDLRIWADQIDSSTMATGGAEFLRAILQRLGHRPTHSSSITDLSVNEKMLFVCGSTSIACRQFCRECEANGMAVVRMPMALLNPVCPEDEYIEEWANATCAALRTQARAVIAIDRPLQRDPRLPGLMSERLGAAVERVLDTHPIQHLLVEGGATAAALVQRFGWTRLRVVNELAPGVVSTLIPQHPGQILTMKPGSYRWPRTVRCGSHVRNMAAHPMVETV